MGGIEAFVAQHSCNAICKALELPTARSLWKEFNEPGDDGSEDDAPVSRPPSAFSNASMSEVQGYGTGDDSETRSKKD